MKFIMTVFKPSGKYYAEEEIDVPDMPFHELRETEQFKEWENMYPDMVKFCTADTKTEEYKKSTFTVPFMIFPKNKDKYNYYF